MTVTVRTALAHAIAQLDQSDSAGLDAQVLLCKVLGKERSWLYAWPEQILGAAQMQEFLGLVERRSHAEPLAYITGKRAFWKLELQVNPSVLIPRPETELLVELALEFGRGQSGPVADLGTGCGAIALALALERPDWQVHASELSDAALQTAAVNLRASGLRNVQLFSGSWLGPLPAGQYRLIVSNPPYIDAADPHLQQRGLAFEPRTALVAGDAGLADLSQIAREASSRLQAGGWLLLEHGWQQAEAVRALLLQSGYQRILTKQDHGGRDRVTLGRWMEQEP
jgi:release factor glutamine methyltransferase